MLPLKCLRKRKVKLSRLLPPRSKAKKANKVFYLTKLRVKMFIRCSQCMTVCFKRIFSRRKGGGINWRLSRNVTAEARRNAALRKIFLINMHWAYVAKDGSVGRGVIRKELQLASCNMSLTRIRKMSTDTQSYERREIWYWKWRKVRRGSWAATCQWN